jgi:putative inorganic carbon (HCO3(-)) transporter
LAGNILSTTKAAAPDVGPDGLEQVVFVALTLVMVGMVVGPLPIVAIAAIGYVALAVWQPSPALGLVVISLPFVKPLYLGSFEISLTEILIVLATVAGAIRLARMLWGPPAKLGGCLLGLKRGLRDALGDPTVSILVLLFVFAGVISLTASVALRESLRSLRTIIIEPALFYFLVVTQVRGRRAIATLLGALVLAGVLISLIGFWQYATDERLITAEAGLRRIRGFYGSPNNLGLFLGRVLPFTFALVLWWKSSRTIWLVAFLIIAVAIVLTFSIGAWLAVAVSMLVVAGLTGRRGRRLAFRGAAVAVVIGALAAWRIPRIGSHFDLQWGTSFIRLEVWQSAARMLVMHPIQGIGLDNFLYYYQHGYRLPTAWQEPDLSHPHNFIFDFWLSLGMPGIVLFGCLVGRFIESIASYWGMSDRFERAIYAGAAGAMVDIVVHGLVDNSFFLPDLAVLFWLIFAIVGVLQREQRRRMHVILRR